MIKPPVLHRTRGFFISFCGLNYFTAPFLYKGSDTEDLRFIWTELLADLRRKTVVGDNDINIADGADLKDRS